MKHPYHLFNLIWKLLPTANIQCNIANLKNLQYQNRLKQCSESSELKSHYPRIDKPKRTLSTYLHRLSRIPLRERALVILRSAHLHGALNANSPLISSAIDHGLSNSDIQLIKVGHNAAGWNKHESLVIRTVDNLHLHQQMSPNQWRALSRTYDPGQIFDLVIYSAAFHLTCFSDQ